MPAVLQACRIPTSRTDWHMQALNVVMSTPSAFRQSCEPSSPNAKDPPATAAAASAGAASGWPEPNPGSLAALSRARALSREASARSRMSSSISPARSPRASAHSATCASTSPLLKCSYMATVCYFQHTWSSCRKSSQTNAAALMQKLDRTHQHASNDNLAFLCQSLRPLVGGWVQPQCLRMRWLLRCRACDKAVQGVCTPVFGRTCQSAFSCHWA